MIEHPPRVLKRQLSLPKVRYRGLAKNTAQIVTLFALSNLRVARRQLTAARRLHCAIKARKACQRAAQ